MGISKGSLRCEDILRAQHKGRIPNGSFKMLLPFNALASPFRRALLLLSACWEVGGISPFLELSFSDCLPRFLFFSVALDVEGKGGASIGGLGTTGTTSEFPSV